MILEIQYKELCKIFKRGEGGESNLGWKGVGQRRR